MPVMHSCTGLAAVLYRRRIDSTNKTKDTEKIEWLIQSRRSGEEEIAYVIDI